MLKSDAIAEFGSIRATAKAALVSYSAVHQWGRLVPPLAAARLEIRSEGRLKFDPNLYSTWKKKSPTLRRARNGH